MMLQAIGGPINGEWIEVESPSLVISVPHEGDPMCDVYLTPTDITYKRQKLLFHDDEKCKPAPFLCDEECLYPVYFLVKEGVELLAV